MQENMLLIKEINMQRGHNKAAKRVLEAQARIRAVNNGTVRVNTNVIQSVHMIEGRI